jgi:D-xylose transport system ATP-binding protein
VTSVRTSVVALSGGQRQIVAIAKAVLRDSKVVLLDEPTAALGVGPTRQVLDLVRRLAAEQGIGVVLISHNIADVFTVSDRIAILYLGRLVADLPTRELTPIQVVELITTGRSGELGLPRPDTGTL